MISQADMDALREAYPNDDFVQSLCDQYDARGYLTERQLPYAEERLDRIGHTSSTAVLVAPTMPLSDHQSVAVDTVMDAIEGGARVVGLTGPAGTGKTFSMKWLAHRVEKEFSTKPLIGATTHPAASVLRKDGLPQAETIHKHAGLRPRGDGSHGYLVGRKMASDLIVICDEASMADEELIKAVTQQLLHGCLILVGDHAQLPPVNGTDMFDAYLEKQGATVARLSEVVRTKNPVLLDIFQAYRPENYDGRSWPEDTPGGEIEWVDRDDALMQFFIDLPDPKDCMVVAYTNRVVNELNARGRAEKYGVERAKAEPYIVGEQLISNAAVIVGNKPVINNGQMVEIIEVSAGATKGLYNLFVQVLEPSATQAPTARVVCAVGVAKDLALSGLEATAQGLHSSLLEVLTDFCVNGRAELDKFQRTRKTEDLAAFLKAEGFDDETCQVLYDLDRERRDAWRKFYDTKNALADLRPTWCRTVHKSQGSTTGTILIDVKDIEKAHEDWRALAYVAMSRAKTRVRLMI